MAIADDFRQLISKQSKYVLLERFRMPTEGGSKAAIAVTAKVSRILLSFYTHGQRNDLTAMVSLRPGGHRSRVQKQESDPQSCRRQCYNLELTGITPQYRQGHV
jgi:hypothetical protein